MAWAVITWDDFPKRKAIKNLEGNMADTVESKHDKFKRLATPRVTSALKKIELIGNLAASSYEYTPDEVEKIFGALQETLNSTKARFSKEKKQETKPFAL